MTYVVAAAACVASAAPALSLALGLFAIDPPVASAAATITVSTPGDETQAGNGTCSLREAIAFANGTAEPDCAPGTASGSTTINLPSGAYVLTGGALSLTGDATLAGAGATTTTITAAGASQVFTIGAAAHAAISDVTVTGGNTGTACGGGMCGLGQPRFGLPGGGINNAGALSLSRVIVTGNRTSAGAINPQCNLECGGGNGGDGGGINNTGALTIANSTITGNTTGAGAAGAPGPPNQNPGASGRGGNGGAISNFGTLTITNSTISGNTTGAGLDGARGADASPRGGNASGGGAGGSGGGIENGGPLSISGTTLVGNQTSAGGKGGTGGNGTDGGNGGNGGNGGSGGAIDSTADMTITNSTLVANAAAGGGGAGANGIPSGPVGPGPGQPGIGGAIDQRAMGTTLTHVTITANSASGAGGGVDGAGGTVTVGNSIIAGNVAAPPSLNCAGVLTDQGGNIEFAAASCPAGFLRADPGLTALSDNGGPTQTIALRPGGGAIHHVPTCVLATDQRGVARPVGAPCDSGAYQVAPPAVTGVSTGAVTTTAVTVSAGVKANLQDTTAVVNFGTTPSYGSSTPPSHLGAGNSPVPFTTGLSGLRPNTTYHFDVVATNADGRTTTSDGVFKTLPPLGASIARASTAGPELSLTIACAGGSGPGRCAGHIGLTERVASKRGHVARRKPRLVAGGSYSVQSGKRVTVHIKLNRMGRNLLSAHYVLATTLSLRGTTRVTRTVTFKYPLIKSRISYTFAFTSSSSTASELTVRHVPQGGRVLVTCHGGGCPFSQRSFAASHGQVVLAQEFRHSPLRPGAKLQLEVVAANRVGKVESFTIRSAQPPAVSILCLPPGMTRPTRCVAR